MTDERRLLAIVPARGGSVGVLRKNLRVIDGQPLVLQRLETLRAAGLDPIVCSTDDPVIASIARMAGFEVHDRSERTAGPAATIADVVTEVVRDRGWTGPVGVFQPTSPGLSADRIRIEVRNFLVNDTLRTAATVAPVHDVCWTVDGPIGEWVNRQHGGPSVWRETGGMRLVRDPALLPSMVDMAGHDTIELLDEVEAMDVDDHAQLAGVRQALYATTVTLVAVAGRLVGSGHLHRCLTLADELTHHDVQIVLQVPAGDDPEPWEQLVLEAGHRLGDVQPADGGVVVFDVLRTDPTTVWALKQMGLRVAVIEDDGPGAFAADLVVNELAADGPERWRCGPDYAVLRPEFLRGRPHGPSQAGSNAGDGKGRVLLYFGGTDPARLTDRLQLLLQSAGHTVTVATGYTGRERVTLAEQMALADVLVTAAGRAVPAAAHIGVPTISIPVNGREVAHARLDSAHYLPRAEIVSDRQVLEAVAAVLGSPALRLEMSGRGQHLVDGAGTQRIAALIDRLAEGL
jgi:spore coat polysaccharide biosynthesis predicted glycosyltransferase SpsG